MSCILPKEYMERDAYPRYLTYVYRISVAKSINALAFLRCEMLKVIYRKNNVAFSSKNTYYLHKTMTMMRKRQMKKIILFLMRKK